MKSALLQLLFVLPLPWTEARQDGPVGSDGRTENASVVQEAPPQNHAISAVQSELLELAFAAASAMPTHPHVKNRARAQEEVVFAALELKLPERALGYARQIDNWRRANCLAAYAHYAAEHGFPETARRAEREALEALHHARDNQTPYERLQEWMVERVRGKLARMRHLLGEKQQASAQSEGLSEDSLADLATIHTERLEVANFESEFERLKSAAAAGDFDTVAFALHTATNLFGQFYEDQEKRDQLEQLVRDSWRILPLRVRMELLLSLADQARKQNDQGNALRLVGDARAVVDGFAWLVQDKLPLVARVATVRFQSGDPEAAEAELAAALGEFREGLDKVADVFRAAALRPAAEALVAFGKQDSALEVYRWAFAEGLKNPNSRPRAQDLVATATSIARQGASVDAEFMAGLRAAVAALSDPW